MRLLEPFPILLVDDELEDETAAGRSTRALVDHLRADGTQVITATGLDDARQIVDSDATISCLLIDWDSHHPAELHNGRTIAVLDPSATRSATEALIRLARERNPALPIFVLADHTTADLVPPEILRLVTDYVWKLGDTPAFIAARIVEARHEYLEPLLPPFFDALVRFVEEARYSWHTPGHSGGTAFLKTPAGAAFHEFFGENTLRSDLSVSVSELGSLLEHSGPIGAAEAEAARTFGADRTMFVTNGTSTANKIVFHSCVRDGDIVLVDRNCHKSVMHAIVMTGAIPVYLIPERNAYGIIGPIPPRAFTERAVRASLAANPLVTSDVDRAALAVVTNCTYDGLCYDAGGILRELSSTSRRVLFDEAWFGYAHFHPLYRERHATGVRRENGLPATFATQSTHKLLTAFSQASMIHLQDEHGLVSPAALEEAFMMHTSTSPQYGIIASLDVATRMMEGPQGTSLIDDAVDEAVAFRRQLATIAAATPVGDWSFRAWQPDEAVLADDFEHHDPEPWALRDGQTWHGFRSAGDGHVMLDPIKVTVLTPGVARDGSLTPDGIPAAIVSQFLSERGIIVEKTGAYSFLLLFSLGITRGKEGTLLTELLEFKRRYDADAPLRDAMPRLVATHPQRYANVTLRELADDMHRQQRAARLDELSEAMYGELPEPAVRPADAYRALVAGDVELVSPSQLSGRISAGMIVPYPPGIPVAMPGERFDGSGSAIIDFLNARLALDARFPGFETEIHGMQLNADGRHVLPVLCERT